MKIFTRDLMGEMEIDLDTKLDWVAANHYDTSRPHTHIVVRGINEDGQKLIIPREYISYGMREAAEELLTNELGPIKQIHYAQRVAMQIRQERFTSLDKNLLNKSMDSVVDLKRSRLAEMDWQNRFESQRAKFLNEVGLAEKIGPNKWRLDDNLERTLRRMGERGDIIRTYQRAISEAKLQRSEIHEPIYDSLEPTAHTITGKVIKTGILDDVNDRSYLVLDTLEGEALFVEAGSQVNIEDIKSGMIVKAGPQSYSPKQSDYTITELAAKRGGVYSPSAHEISDPSAREEYIQAHVRRVKAGEHDKAWGLLHEEQGYYARHAAKNSWSNTQLISLTGNVHEGFANILRKEKKHSQALAHLLFWIKSDKRPVQYRATKRHEAKLKSYFNRCKFEGVLLDEVMEYAKADDGLADLLSIRTQVSEWQKRSDIS